MFSSRVQQAWPRDTSRLSPQGRQPGAPGLSLHAGPAHGREGTLRLVSDMRIARATGSSLSIMPCLHVSSFPCKHENMQA